MKQNYYSDSEDGKNLLEKVNQCISLNKPINESLAWELLNAKSKDISWELFYKILEVPNEASTGYWNAVNVACTLLKPTINSIFMANQNKRINENINEDFLSEVKIAIQECIPSFNKEISHFPNYVSNYIRHVGYVYNKDSSTYMQETKGYRIFSQNAMVNTKNHKGEDMKVSADPYDQVDSNFSIEDELEKRDKLKNSQFFSAFVIDKINDKDYCLEISEAKKRKANLINKLDDISFALKDNNNRDLTIDGVTYQQEQKEKLIKNIKEDLNKCNKLLKENDEKTIINTSFYTLFLGGFNSFSDKIKTEAINNIIETFKQNTSEIFDSNLETFNNKNDLLKENETLNEER